MYIQLTPKRNKTTMLDKQKTQNKPLIVIRNLIDYSRWMSYTMNKL